MTNPRTAARATLALASTILLLTGCGSSTGTGSSTSSSPGTPADPAALAGQWVLESNEAITLEVTETGAVSGSSGCNTYMTSVTGGEASGELTFGPAATTRMACDQAVMDAEHTYLTQLEAVSHGTLDGTRLVLETTEGDDLVFTAAS